MNSILEIEREIKFKREIGIDKRDLNNRDINLRSRD